jgi:predicted ATPase
MLTALAVAGYRSLRDLVIPLDRLNLITGANGTGKSNLYRALRLLADTAQGQVIPALAREGGLSSTLWAGPEELSRAMKQGSVPVQGTPRKHVVSLRLGFAGDQLSYAIDLGLPTPSKSAFAHDPEIKRECIWNGPVLRPASLLVDRHGPLVKRRGERAGWDVVMQGLASFDSMMTHCSDPRGAPEVLVLREDIRLWRFYDQLRTDATAPARLPQVGTHTPVLGHDGADLAAALQTIAEIGDREGLGASVSDAFPGSAVDVRTTNGRFEVELHQHGLLRPLKAAELSDGTLRYLLWIAALLTPRPPGLLVLNEPETSLHPDVLPALARLIAKAAERSQVVVVSHSVPLIDALQQRPECHTIAVTKKLGETTVLGNEDEGEWAARERRPQWHWPVR